MRWTNGLVGTLITGTQVTGDWVSRNLRETLREEKPNLTRHLLCARHSNFPSV